MRKHTLAVGLLVLFGALTASVPAGAQNLLLDYVGYDYEFPDPVPGTFGEVGAGYNGLGLVPGLFSPLVADTSANQYTYVITGLTVSNVSTYGSYQVIDYSGPGTLTVYEDAKSGGTAADYGINPPNGTAPSSFVDGTTFLVGSLTAFQIVMNTDTNSGSYEAVFEVTGGSQYGNIPATDRSGWTFAGATGNELNRPEGYAHQIDGQIFLNRQVPTRATTWGRLKSSYR